MNTRFNLFDIQMSDLATWALFYKEEPLSSRIVNTSKPPIPVEFGMGRLPNGVLAHTSAAYNELVKELVKLVEDPDYYNAKAARKEELVREVFSSWLPCWLPVFDRLEYPVLEVTT